MNGDDTTATTSAPHVKAVNVWRAATAPDQEDTAVLYVIRHPWQWVMKSLVDASAAAHGAMRMSEVTSPKELPSAKEAPPEAAPSPATRRRRSQKKARPQGATFRLEVSTATGGVKFAVHGTSATLDGLDDKDELVRTMQRCRCDHLHLSPPSILINWDVSREICLNVVGQQLPVLQTNNHVHKMAVLKEPMGSQGKGIFFVRNADEIFEIIDEHHKRAANEPDILENLISVKGRIPSWVLQAEVVPALLLRDRRKFHIRSYLIVIEHPRDEEVLDMYIYNRHEVRIAGVPVDASEDGRNRLAHITNGALSDTTERTLLHLVPELVQRGLQSKLEVFIAETFAKHLLIDISRRINSNGSHHFHPQPPQYVQEFALAGLDIMVTEDNRLYLLEVNANPAAPPENMASKEFGNHLKGFLGDLIDLVTGQPPRNFLDAFGILERNGIE